jgi:hypothetical protein
MTSGRRDKVDCFIHLKMTEVMFAVLVPGKQLAVIKDH